MPQLNKQRLVVNDASDKADYFQSKLNMIEKHLPMMIQETLDCYFDKKVSELLSSIVTREEFKESLTLKLDYCIFRDYEKMIASDRTQELKNFEYEEKIFNLERSLNDYVRIEDNVIDLQDKVSLSKLDELQDVLNNLKSINTTTEETLSHKLN